MQSEHFERSAITAEGGHPIPARAIRCAKCGAVEKITTNKSRCLPDAALANFFRNKGWIVGRKPSEDICPSCQRAERKTPVPVLPAPATPVVESNVVEFGIRAEPPEQATKEDRRVIFAKLNDVYIDEAKGYDSDWSDQKVADDLGVPVAWVRSIREENFGSNPGNERMTSAVVRAEEILAMLEHNHKTIRDAVTEQFERLLNKFEAEVELKKREIERTIEQAKKAAGIRS